MPEKYKDKRTAEFAAGDRIKEFQAFERQAYKRLEILEAAPNKESLILDRRIPDIETLEQETTAWYIQRNHSQKSVDWQFTTADARIRLKRLYPQIEI